MKQAAQKKTTWGHQRNVKESKAPTKFSFNATKENAKHLIAKKKKGVRIGDEVNTALELRRKNK